MYLNSYCIKLLICNILILLNLFIFGSNVKAETGKIPRRIVSLAPVLTEMLLELNAIDSLVGRTSYCKVPNGHLSTEVGGYLDTSIERVVSLKPDYVISLKGNTRTAERLRKLGIKVEEFSNERIVEIEDAFLILGERLDRKNLAKKIIRQKSENVNALIRELKSQVASNQSFLYLLNEGSVTGSRQIYYAAGKGSFYEEILELMGFRNSLNSGMKYATLGIEGMRSLKPDLVFISGSDIESKEECIHSKCDSNSIIEENVLSPHSKLIRITDKTILYPGINYDKIIEIIGKAIISEAR